MRKESIRWLNRDIAIFISGVLLASPIMCLMLIIALPFELRRAIQNPEA